MAGRLDLKELVNPCSVNVIYLSPRLKDISLLMYACVCM